MADAPAERMLPLRIVVMRPPAGVGLAVQRGRSDLLAPSRTSEDAAVFELSVRVAARGDGEPNLLGPFAHGTPADRFLYINWGTSAGQPGSRWTRRAKLKDGRHRLGADRGDARDARRRAGGAHRGHRAGWESVLRHRPAAGLRLAGLAGWMI